MFFVRGKWPPGPRETGRPHCTMPHATRPAGVVERFSTEFPVTRTPTKPAPWPAPSALYTAESERPHGTSSISGAGSAPSPPSPSTQQAPSPSASANRAAFQYEGIPPAAGSRRTRPAKATARAQTSAASNRKMRCGEAPLHQSKSPPKSIAVLTNK